MDVSPTQGGTVKIDETISTTYPTMKTVANGTSIVIEAIPAEGYEFAGWSGSLTGQENPVTIEMTCPKNITATFSEKGQFNLIIEVSGGGSVTPSAGVHSYYAGNVVNITATPNTGYRFDSWTGDVSDITSASITVTVDSNKTVTANFSQITHTLTIEVSGGGSVAPSAGEHSCIEGSRINLIATPDDGYRFEGWTGDVSDTSSASTIVTVDSDKTVTANFVQIIHTLTIEVVGKGSVTPSAGEHIIGEGTAVNITATPEAGYKFAGWTGDVNEAEADSIIVIMVEDTSITANFVRAGLSGGAIGGIIAGGIIVIGGVSWLFLRRRKTLP